MLADLTFVRGKKTREAADGSLMMLLAMNLLLLVFFMMLNATATYGNKHASEVLGAVREGYDKPGQEGRAAAPLSEWQQGVVGRVQGLMIERLELVVPPLGGNAARVVAVMPLERMFGADGRVIQPSVVRNLLQAAGDSRVEWTVSGDVAQRERLAAMMASLAAQTGEARARVGAPELRIEITPLGGRGAMGTNVQRIVEGGGGVARGIQDRQK